MLDPFDYKEPSCVLCGGKEFYNPSSNSPISTIPVGRIIEKVDLLYNKNDLIEAGKLLEYWKGEAISLNDKRGELSITDELVGYYRKINDKKRALASVSQCLNLIDILDISDSVSSATIYLNCATTQKAFGLADIAMDLYEKAFIVYEKKLDKNDARFAAFYNNKALTLIDLNRFNEAFECYRKAIAICEKIDSERLNAAISYINLAHAYEQANSEKKPITDCLFNAYNILNGESIEKNGYYAFVLTKCAPSFSYFGYEKISNELITEAKSIYERN